MTKSERKKGIKKDGLKTRMIEKRLKGKKKQHKKNIERGREAKRAPCQKHHPV